MFFLTVTVFSEDEPGKQVKSAIGIKNTSKSHVAFKVSIDSSRPLFVFSTLLSILLLLHIRN